MRGPRDAAIGSADSASEGAAERESYQARPKLRPGDIVEAVPGVVATQHSGDGKANQSVLDLRWKWGRRNLKTVGPLPRPSAVRVPPPRHPKDQLSFVPLPIDKPAGPRTRCPAACHGGHEELRMHAANPARGPRPFLRRLARLALGIAAFGAALLAPAAPNSKPSYDYYLTGNPADAASSQPPRSPSTLLMGGGPDVDAAFRWMIDKAGGGDFVVIRASGADGYNQYVYLMGGVDSVESLVIPSVEAANDPFVVERVRKAEALFIAGGDQSDYIEFWKGTALDGAIRDLVRRNVPIGGTSAGLAVLGQFDFAALKGSVTSADALANPYNRRMTLDREFLTAAAMTGVITDSHFDERDRMGRLLAFLARLTNPGDGWTNSMLLMTAMSGRYFKNLAVLSKNALSYSSPSMTNGAPRRPMR